MAGINSGKQLKTGSSKSFVGPIVIKNKPSNFTSQDYKKAIAYDYDNDGVVDYEEIESEIKNVDLTSSISDIENDSQIKELDKKIEELNSSLEEERPESWKLASEKQHAIRDGALRSKGNTKEAVVKKQKEHNKKIAGIRSQIQELEKQKEARIKELKISIYTSLMDNSDFSKLSVSKITQEEAEEITKMMSIIPSSVDFVMSDEELFYDYDKLKKYLSDQFGDNWDSGLLNWDLIESGYKKGFNMFEIANLNEHLKTGEVPYVYGMDGDKTVTYYANEINYMRPEEISIANYLYNKYGKAECDAYFDTIQQELNSREGLARALEFISTIDMNDPNAGDYIKAHFKGLGDGVNQFFHGIEVWCEGPSEILTPDQYEATYITTLLSMSNSNVDLGFLGEFNGLEKVYTLSSSEGNMLPSMVIGTVGSMMGIEGLGVASMFFSVSGNATERAYQEGYDLWRSWFYGCLSGASEAGLEYLLGGIPGVSKLEDKSFLFKLIGEGTEEMLQEMIDPYLKYMATGEKPTIDWGKVLEAGIDGVLLAAYLNGGEAVIGEVIVEADALKDRYDKIKELEKKGVEIDYARITEDGYLDSLKSQEVVNLGDLSNIGYNKTEISNALSEYDLTKESIAKVCDLIMETDGTVDYAKFIENLNTYNSTELTAFFTITSQINPEVVNNLFQIENAKPEGQRSTFVINLTANLLGNVLDYYQEAAELAGSLDAFKTYRTHTEGHVIEVADMSMQAMTNIEKSLNSKYQGQFNYYELYAAAIWHDIGMGASENGYIPGIDAQFNKKTGEYNPKILEETKSGNITRSNHALNSALMVLENSTYFNSIGLDSNVVALLAFAHTKSNSGIKDITNASNWDTAIRMLDAAWAEKNKGTEYTGFINGLLENGVIEEVDGKYVFTSEYKARIYAETYALRYGDANTTNRDLGINQAGKELDIKTNNPNSVTTYSNEQFDSIVDIIKTEYSAKQTGVKDGKATYGISHDKIEISIDGKSLSMEECDPITVAFIAGENNVKLSTSNTSPISGSLPDGHVHEKIEIQDSSIVGPTMFNIDERVGEVVTGSGLVMGNTTFIDIVFPEGTIQEIIDFYMNNEKLYSNANSTVTFCYYIKQGNRFIKIHR